MKNITGSYLTTLGFLQRSKHEWYKETSKFTIDVWRIDNLDSFQVHIDSIFIQDFYDVAEFDVFFKTLTRPLVQKPEEELRYETKLKNIKTALNKLKVGEVIQNGEGKFVGYIKKGNKYFKFTSEDSTHKPITYERVENHVAEYTLETSGHFF